MNKKGTFIVFEGGEGSGKDANIEYIQDKFKHRNDIIFTREPGGTEIGERIRSILMENSFQNMSVKTELLLFLAARAQLMKEVIAPAINNGKHVISNRFALSAIAYQIFRKDRHEYYSFLSEITNIVIGNVKPNYILLDVRPHIGIMRTKKRKGEITRFDTEPLENHHKVREGYLKSIKNFQHIIINAERPLKIVQKDVYKYVLNSIKNKPTQSI